MREILGGECLFLVAVGHLFHSLHDERVAAGAATGVWPLSTCAAPAHPVTPAVRTHADDQARPILSGPTKNGDAARIERRLSLVHPKQERSSFPLDPSPLRRASGPPPSAPSGAGRRRRELSGRPAACRGPPAQLRRAGPVWRRQPLAIGLKAAYSGLFAGKHSLIPGDGGT